MDGLELPHLENLFSFNVKCEHTLPLDSEQDRVELVSSRNLFLIIKQTVWMK